jgi:lipopolysaccharide export system protein LptA
MAPCWLGLLAAVLLLLPSATPRPVLYVPAGPAKVRYTIEGGSLTILNHPSYREFRYEGGVAFSGEGVKLTAGALYVEVNYGDVSGRDKIKLPTPDPAALERDPSGTAAQLAREIYLPSPELTPDMLQLIRATGGVEVAFGEVKLSAAELISADGGQTWHTAGRATVSAREAKTGGALELATDELSYNIASQTGHARGHITAKFSNAHQPAASISAGQLDFDVLKQRLAASGTVQTESSGLRLTCGSLSADLASQLLTAGGSPQLNEPERQLSLSADGLTYDMAHQLLSASGHVAAQDALHSASLTADGVEYAAAQERLTATGQPRLQQGNSSYTGEVLRVWREADGKLVVEVEGKQQGRIDLSQFKGAGQAKGG